MTWTTKKLGEIAEIIMGQSPKGDSYNNNHDGTPLINGPVEFGEYYPKKIKFTTAPIRFSQKGDLLLSIRATIGILNWSDDKYCLGRGVSAIRIKTKGALKEYIWYVLNTYSRKLNSMAVGAVISGVSRNDLYNLKISLPPLLTQKLIAERLDKIVEAQSSNNELLRKTDELFQSLLQHVLNPVGKHWKTTKLADICEFHNGKAHEKIIVNGGKYIVVNSKFIASNARVIKRSDYNLSPLEVGDVAIVMSDIPNGRALARCFLVPQNDKYSLNQRIGSVRSKELNPTLLYYQLNRNKYFLKFNNGQSQTNLKKADILNCPLFVPANMEQKQIVTRLTAIQACRNQLLEQKANLLELFESVLYKAMRDEMSLAPVPDAIPEIKWTPKDWFNLKLGVTAVLERWSRGEMVVAKLLYLVQQVKGVDFGLTFARHNFGPYNSKVKQVLYAKDNYFVKHTVNGYPVFAVSQKAKEQLLRYNSSVLRQSRLAVQDLANEINNLTSPQIEIIATICKIIEDTQSIELLNIQSELNNWKDKIDRFTPEQVSAARNFIISKNWHLKLMKENNHA